LIAGAAAFAPASQKSLSPSTALNMAFESELGAQVSRLRVFNSFACWALVVC
jgi:hypothetical protein